MPDDVAALIVQLLEKDPASRVQTAAEVVARVREIEGSGPVGQAFQPDSGNREQVIGKRSQSGVATSRTDNSISSSACSASESSLRVPLRNRWRVGTVAAAFILLAGVIVIVRDKDGKIVAWFRALSGVKVEVRGDAAGAIVAEFAGAFAPYNGVCLLAWSGDGGVLWTADSSRIRSWRAADGALLTDRDNSAPFLANAAQWTLSADSRRIVAPSGVARILDTATGELQVAFVPLRDWQAAIISPDGHWRGTVRADQEIVYVVETSEGQQVLSPKEFATQYDWKNDPQRVTLGGEPSRTE